MPSHFDAIPACDGQTDDSIGPTVLTKRPADVRDFAVKNEDSDKHRIDSI